MNSVRETDVKNRAYYFLNNIINIKNHYPNKIKIDKKTYKYSHLLHRIQNIQ